MNAAKEPTFDEIRRALRRANDAIDDPEALVEALRDELLAEANSFEYGQRDLGIARLLRRRANSEEYRRLVAASRLAQRALLAVEADGAPFGLSIEEQSRRSADRLARMRAFDRAIPAMIKNGLNRR